MYVCGESYNTIVILGIGESLGTYFIMKKAGYSDCLIKLNNLHFYITIVHCFIQTGMLKDICKKTVYKIKLK